MEQRSLKRKAGISAQRPLTRSSVKPRLLFPSEDQLREREEAVTDLDEEAVTDIEMPNASSPVKQKATAEEVATPIKDYGLRNQHLATPPPTKRTTRTTNKKTSPPTHPSPIYEDEPEPISAGVGETFPAKGGRRGGRSPFDAWQRTKAGSSKGSHKREAAPMEEGARGGKRTRSAMIDSPA